MMLGIFQNNGRGVISYYFIKGSLNGIQNYRGITLLSTTGKKKSRGYLIIDCQTGQNHILFLLKLKLGLVQE